MEPKILSIEEILAAQDLKEELVDCPEWGGAVKIRSYTLDVRRKIRDEAFSKDGKLDMDQYEKLRWLACVIEPRFTPEQYDRLKDKAAAPFNRVQEAITRLTDYSAEAVRDAARCFRGGPGEACAVCAGADAGKNRGRVDAGDGVAGDDRVDCISESGGGGAGGAAPTPRAARTETLTHG